MRRDVGNRKIKENTNWRGEKKKIHNPLKLKSCSRLLNTLFSPSVPLVFMYRKTYRLDPAPLRLGRSAQCEISMPDPRGETRVKAHKYFKSGSAASPSRSSLSALTPCRSGSRFAMAAYGRRPRRPNRTVKSFTNNQTITVLTTEV